MEEKVKKLGKVTATFKTGKEKLIFDENNTEYQLLDFWRWAVSDILSNATRGKFAEFIVGTVLNVDLKKPSDEWGAYDLISKSGLKIEVKTSAYIQSWNQKEYSKPLFSIKKAKFWDSEKNMTKGKPKRHADIYIFCLLKEKKQEVINPLNLSQWEFYPVLTETLNNYKRSQQSITLPSLQKISEPVLYSELKNKVSEMIKQEK